MSTPPKSGPPQFKIVDPFGEREAQKYERPIPSRELILKIIEDNGGALSIDEITELSGLSDESDLIALNRRLAAMERDGQVVRNRKQRYCLVNRKDLITGRVIGHPDGFGFVKPDEGGDDLFLSPREMQAVMHNDRVVVSVTGIDRRGRREGGIVEVLERNTKCVVGRLHIEDGVAYVVPDHKQIAQDILIPDHGLGGAYHSQIVVAEIIEQPSTRRKPLGKIVEVLGEHMAPGMEIEIAIRAHDLPWQWPDDVTAEISGLGRSVPEAAKIGRVDIRDLPLVTIDGDDSRDFDDAVFCERKAKSWQLIVAIADVSHYVRPDTALDREAQLRGNSVYFPERVIPMLPEVLSNGLCSLNPGEDRLCMAAEIFIDDHGKIIRSRFFDAVMHSHARLTYTQVAAMLVDQRKDLRARYAPLLPDLEELYRLYQVLRAGREARGAIDFETQETRIVFGSNRKIEKIVPVVRNDAHKLIEECMIVANIATARFLRRQKIPHLRRVHDSPTQEKLADLRTFLHELGLSLGGGDQPTAKDYSELLSRIKARPDAHLIQTVLLRSMPQAVYSTKTAGHFGLGLEDYTHFTSPIRRYPDLIVHRAIRHGLDSQQPETFVHSHNDLVIAGEQCSSTERRADEAVRNVVSWLKCEYMQDKLGTEFDGVISAVTSFGLFVEIKDVFVEGLVHISTLGSDYYHFDPIHHRLRGERSGHVFRLGDQIRVLVARVDLDEKKIDFELVRPKDTSKPAVTGPKPGQHRKRR